MDACHDTTIGIDRGADPPTHARDRLACTATTAGQLFDHFQAAVQLVDHGHQGADVGAELTEHGVISRQHPIIRVDHHVLPAAPSRLDRHGLRDLLRALSRGSGPRHRCTHQVRPIDPHDGRVVAIGQRGAGPGRRAVTARGAALRPIGGSAVHAVDRRQRGQRTIDEASLVLTEDADQIIIQRRR